ncbi:MAG TPA: helix-turn-helix transcriptional regulator [Candidatus Krumholzibacteria bacterium]|nr:helix-turn-helix transcriptional regulator [Candidatus Krumholzibacteria bacterium]
MPDAFPLRNRLKALRAEKNWTQADLAEQVGVTRKTINTVERGVFTPSTLLALKLAHAFETTVEEIFWIDEERST